MAKRLSLEYLQEEIGTFLRSIEDNVLKRKLTETEWEDLYAGIQAEVDVVIPGFDYNYN